MGGGGGRGANLSRRLREAGFTAFKSVRAPEEQTSGFVVGLEESAASVWWRPAAPVDTRRYGATWTAQQAEALRIQLDEEATMLMGYCSVLAAKGYTAQMVTRGSVRSVHVTKAGWG
jgi:hypothetical protein